MTQTGLEGIVVADTWLSQVDGQRGRLVIAGERVERLAEGAPFEATVARLWRAAGLEVEVGALRRQLGRYRQQAFAEFAASRRLRREEGMEALRAGLASLSLDGVPSAEQPAAAVAALPVLATAWWNRKQGRAAVAPDPTRSTSEDLLGMLGASRVALSRVRALDTYLSTVVDHGMNASTFTARVVASTGSDWVSCLVAALGALKGPLHGGAPGPVLDMLDAVGSPERAEAWVAAELGAGRRLMGFGHRVYRVRDPRAAVLERALSELGGAETRLATARAVETAATRALNAAHPERPMGANVEFATALLLDAIGIPRELFTSTFAVSRSAGWVAHIAEQRATGRLIRPDSRYVGPQPEGG